jgi:hypothetical protein
MANQTVSANANFDDAGISGLANGEDITINTGATLTINSDVRWGQQAAVIGAITIDSSTGGTCTIDGTDVWWIPFDASSGNVPTLGTAGTEDCTGSVAGSGEFLGIWTALGVAPSASGGAMPGTGFLKLRQRSVAFADNEVITLPGGATCTVNSTTGGQRGWIHVVGEEAATITVPRVGRFESLGDWFELGTTNGSDDQTFQFYVADQCPAIQVETGSGTGIYEWWVCAGTTRWAQANLRVATDARGKMFGCSTAGVITIATRVGNDSGFKPVSGCKVRVPNIHYSSSTSANWATNLRNTTLATRWDFTTTSAGDIELDKSSLNIYASFSQPYAVVVTDCGFLDQLLISECATEPVLTRAVVGLSAAIDTAPISIASCFSGVTMDGCVALKYEAESADTGTTVTDCDDVTITGGIYYTFGDNTAATLNRGAGSTGALTLTRVTNSVLNDVAVIGASCRIVSCINVQINDLVFGHQVEGQTTNSTNPVSAIDISGASADIVVDGYGGNFAAIANIHPYNAIVAIAASYDCTVQNIGTPASPYDCGSANACAGGVALGGNGSGHKIKRVYTTNARTGGATDTNSDARIEYVNVWGDGADTGFVLNALNSTAKGLRSTNPTTGATAVYGTHFYDTFVSTTEARLVFLANEPTDLSGTKLQTTAGTAVYTSTGQVKLLAVNDAIVWEMDYFCLGWTALNNASPTFSGTNSANHTIDYQIDTGSGWSSWKTANGTNLSGETISSTTGFRLKLRATCNSASTTNAIINIRITGTTTSGAQQEQYPLQTVPVSVTTLDAASSSDIESARILLRASTGSTVTITRASSTATVTHTAHGFRNGKKVVISGAVEGEYNGIKTITVVDANTYTYTVSGTPATPATGTITSYRVILDGATDSNGLLTDPEVELIGSSLAVSGTARKGTAAPYYKPTPLSGTVSTSGLSITSYLVGDA